MGHTLSRRQRALLRDGLSAATLLPELTGVGDFSVPAPGARLPVAAAGELPGTGLSFRRAQIFVLNFLRSLSVGKTGNLGESGGASQPQTSSLPLSQPWEGGVAWQAVPLMIQPCALLWAETLPSAQSTFFHLLCPPDLPKLRLLGFK